jgi:ADP-ribosylglycohydrolase
LRGRSYVEVVHEYVEAYPHADYGIRFAGWARSKSRVPYGSFGNGSAMRVSPAAYAHDSLEQVLAEARRSAAITHDHPEGIRGAEATAAAIFLGRTGASKDEIRAHVARHFAYDLSRTIEELRPAYEFDETCQGTVPAAIVAFLDSSDFESAIRLAVSLGGDADTLACITGGIAEAYYGGVPEEIEREVWERLDPRLSGVVREFRSRFVVGRLGTGVVLPSPPSWSSGSRSEEER